MRSSLQKGHNSNRKKSTGRHRMTQNAITNPSLNNALITGGKSVPLTSNCERNSPHTRNRRPSSRAISACRRKATIAPLFSCALNRQYLRKSSVIFFATQGSIHPFGRKIMALSIASDPHVVEFRGNREGHYLSSKGMHRAWPCTKNYRCLA